jgi:hypothetical protein
MIFFFMGPKINLMISGRLAGTKAARTGSIVYMMQQIINTMGTVIARSEA